MAGLLVVEAADLTDAEPASSTATAGPWAWAGLVLLLGPGGAAVARRRLRRGATDAR